MSPSAVVRGQRRWVRTCCAQPQQMPQRPPYYAQLQGRSPQEGKDLSGEFAAVAIT